MAEFLGYVAGLIVLLLALTMVIGYGGMLGEHGSLAMFFVSALPSLLMVAGFTYLLYSLADHLVSGVLLTFFAILALCFVGGCMYPTYVFPETLQRLSSILPVGIARADLIRAVQGKGCENAWALLGYGVGFVGAAILVRAYKIGKVRW